MRIALPNKGRLADAARRLFEQAGLPAETKGERALVADLGSDFEALFVRAADIPEFVADGAAEAGVTGADLVAESGRELEELLDLEFGRCRLVVAAREGSGVCRPEDVAGGARVATAFPRLARKYFAGLGTEVEIAPVSGAAEIAPHLGVADVIVDLTSTGSTLRMNGLEEVATVLESSARLVANREAWADDALRPRLSELVVALESVLRARSRRYLMANVPRDRIEEVREILPGINGPTVVELMDRGRWVAAHAVVEADRVYRTIARLRELGAQGILVTPIERLVP